MFCRSSPSRVVGGRCLRPARQASHSHRSRRNVKSPLPRSTSRNSSNRVSEPEQHSLRRSSRLVNSLPRSDYSISERWSYGADVYETRCDTAHLKGGDTPKPSAAQTKRGRTSSHDRKKRKNESKKSECVAHCTRSRTALKVTESACEPTTNTPKSHTTNLSLNQTATVTSEQTNQAEGGLLPLDERDYAYSPFSSSTVTELLDSDYSVYSPKTSRKKGKKRKRSGHHSLSSRKSSCLLNVEECKKLKLEDCCKESNSSDVSSTIKSHRNETEKECPATQSCSYPLRNRHRDLGPQTSTAFSESSGNQPYHK